MIVNLKLAIHRQLIRTGRRQFTLRDALESVKQPMQFYDSSVPGVKKFVGQNKHLIVLYEHNGIQETCVLREPRSNQEFEIRQSQGRFVVIDREGVPLAMTDQLENDVKVVMYFLRQAIKVSLQG